MAFPTLEATSLGCQPPIEEAGEGNRFYRGHGMPPVAGESLVGRGVYVISEAAKRSRSAGMLGYGRVAPFNPTAATHPNPSHRPRSSPRLAYRRHARITPFPTHPQHTSDTTGHVLEGGSGPSHVLNLKGHEGRSHGREEEGHSSSSAQNGLSSSSSSSSRSDTICTTCAEKSHQWSGRYSVPTISIDPFSSPSTISPTLSNSVKTSFDYSKCNDIIDLENNKYVTQRIHNLVSAFSQRARRVKAHITQPPTPSTDLSEGAGEDEHSKAVESRQPLDSLDEVESLTKGSEPMLVGLGGRQAWVRRHLHHLTAACAFPGALEPQSRLYIWWLLVVSIFYVYNACVIPLRSVFSQYQTDENLVWWITVDTLADLIYFVDIIIFKSRVMYLDNGFWISSSSLMRRHYLKTIRFRYDLMSLLPLELFYIKFGPISVFRLPRLLKFHTFWEFFNRVDSVLSSPHAVRVIRTVLYMLFLIHLNTCAYYGFSKYEGIGINKWVFQGDGNAYIRCFYFATKTATSIGKNPKPENKQEYLFMTCSWLMGVFVFALLIGQIRDIVATATRNQNEYRRVMDDTQAYLHRLNLPPSLQERVRLWFAYTWQSQKTLNEMKCLESLPKKMRTDIAINVHIQTLSKVQLFQDCDKALFRDLVLKLQPVLYLPGDFVCKKGEVGKEMYIVQSGQVLVMGGDKVLATLGEGSVFGEISLLALAGGNRRTANVRSRGFSSLFVLSKADLQATIKDYPEAQEILKKKAKKLIRQNEERERQEPADDDNVIIKSRESTPKLLHTVLQVVRPDSFTASVIRRSSRSMSLPSPCPWTSFKASPYTSGSSSTSHDPGQRRSSRRCDSLFRRSSLEVPSVIGGHTVASLSESLKEEEEEDEFVVVETCKELGSTSSSCHSRHTTITLHPSLPSSPLTHIESSCMSTSSHEDVFESESDPENQQSEDHVREERRTREGSGNSQHCILSSQQLVEEDLIQLSPEKEKEINKGTPKKDNEVLRDNQVEKDVRKEDNLVEKDTQSKDNQNIAVKYIKRQKEDIINRKDTKKQPNESQQIKEFQTTGHETVCSDGGGIIQGQEGVFFNRSFSNTNSADYNRESGSVRGNLQASTPPQNPRRSYSLSAKSTADRRERLNSSGSCKYSGKGMTHTQTPDMIKPYYSHPKQHAYSSISFHDQSSHGSPKQDETPITNTDFLSKSHQGVSASVTNTEDLLIKFGLNHDSSDRMFSTHSTTQDSRTSPVSYELFLTELSKTMPNTSNQVPILSSSSSSFSLSSSSSSWQQPPVLSPPPPPHSHSLSPSPSSLTHQISCSAIVHRECTSPNTSPFDAQESKL